VIARFGRRPSGATTGKLPTGPREEHPSRAHRRRRMAPGGQGCLWTVVLALLARDHDNGLLHEIEGPSAQARTDPVGAAIPRLLTEALGREAAADWRPDVVSLRGFAAPAHEATPLDRYASVLYGHNSLGIA